MNLMCHGHASFMEDMMNAKLLVKTFLAIALLVMVTACGGGATPEAPAEVAVNTPIASSTPIPVSTPTVGSTPCLVPDVYGLDQSAAEELIVGLGLQPVKSVQHSEINHDIFFGRINEYS